MEIVQHLEFGLAFGKLTDTPNINYIPVLDLDDQVLYVPCTSFDITIAKFIELYLQTTTYKKIKEEPLLSIEQGTRKGDYAQNDDNLASFGLDLKKQCFRVVDSSNVDFRQEKRRQYERRQQEENQRFRQNKKVQIKVKIDGKIFETWKMAVNLSQRVIDFKKQAIKQISLLSKRTPDQLQIRFNDIRLSNDNQTLSKYQVNNSTTLFIKQKQSGGCFSPDTLVLMANEKAVKIKDIQIGDQVLSYNIQEGQFQKDRVSFMKVSRVQECLKIVFEDGSEIKTTANHLFLCEDGQFRSYTTDLINPDSSKSLKVGMSLISAQKTAKKIKEMYCSQVEFHQNQFYHLSIQNNHTFFVNNVITHNMFIRIKLAQGEQKVNVQPSSSIIQIKESLEELYFIQANNQKLIYGGRQLKDNSTIADNNIPKEATLQLVKKSTQYFNLVKEETLVLLADGTYNYARSLQRGDILRVYDSRNPKGKQDRIELIQEVDVTDYIYLGLNEYEDTVGVSTDTYLQLVNGEAMMARDICYELKETAILRTIDGQTAQVKGTAHIQEQHRPKRFFRISMFESRNIVVRNTIKSDFEQNTSKSKVETNIIIHNKVINLLIMKDQKRLRKISFGVSRGEKVSSILQKLSALARLRVNDIMLVFNEYQLSPERTIQSYEIQNHHLVIAIVQASKSKISKSSILMQALAEEESIQQKVIILQISETQKEIIYYYNDKDRTIQTIIAELLPNYRGSYFFTFDNLILFPSDTLDKLQESPNFKLPENTIVLVKNEKLSFINAMNINKEDVGNYSGIRRQPREANSTINSGIVKLNQFQQRKEVSAACSRIAKDQRIPDAEFRERNFCLPFLYFTCRKYTQKIKKFIMGFEKHKKEQQNQDLLNIIKELYINMQLLPNYYKKCYMGVRNFKFSSFFQKHQTFYLHNFTLAFKDEKMVKKELENKKGTIFHITSLNGKEIQKFSMFPNYQEILFSPFTPFFIEEIIPGQLYDEVYIVELSAPITFQKDIILWVDDQPYNNINEIKTILQKLDIEILQATSTLQAQKWITQFGWLLNWKGLQFKIVTDMTRLEGIVREGVERKKNYSAGIDLLKILYNKHGFNVKTLIYCYDKSNAIKAAQNAQLRNDRFYQITNNKKTMLQFFEIKKK